MLRIDKTGLAGNELGPSLAEASFYKEATVDSLLRVSIDRSTGAITLRNGTQAGVNIVGYSILSAGGALQASNWRSVSANYDADGPNTANGGALIGSVDNNDNWTLLSSPADPTDLSEFELDGGNGATLAVGQTVNLGSAVWVKSPTEDVAFEYVLSTGEIKQGLVDYTGNGGAPFLFGDLNLDGTAFDLSDFTAAMQPNLISRPFSTSLVKSYLAGDLNGDFDVDRDDFYLFKEAFLAAGGAASELAAVQVPEPTALALLLAGVFACSGRSVRSSLSPTSYRRAALRVSLWNPARNSCQAAVTTAILCLALMPTSVNAQSSTPILTVLDDDADRDNAAGPGVVDVDMATHDNGGFGVNADTYNDTFTFNLAGDASSTTYTFTGLKSGRNYDVYGYWRGQANTPQANYAIGDGGPSKLVDQTVRSGVNGPFINILDPDPNANNGALGRSFPFELLGSITESGDGQLTVTITNGGGGGFFLGDAVAVALDYDPLVLEVNTSTGLASIINDGRDTFDIDTYVVTSNTAGVGSLDPTWTGLTRDGRTAERPRPSRCRTSISKPVPFSRLAIPRQ